MRRTRRQSGHDLLPDIHETHEATVRPRLDGCELGTIFLLESSHHLKVRSPQILCLFTIDHFRVHWACETPPFAFQLAISKTEAGEGFIERRWLLLKAAIGSHEPSKIRTAQSWPSDKTVFAHRATGLYAAAPPR